MDLASHEVKDLPKAPPFRKLFGPSFILLGLGLGSGEIILWPYLAANWGLGIIWGAVLGITFQFFMNMEIERYALARGESVFVGFARKVKYFPVWFILSTFAGFAWPGIVGASAALIGSILGLSQTQYLAIVFLLLIGVILTLGPVLYKTVERLTFWLLAIGVPVVIFLASSIASRSDWESLAKGVVGIGEGYAFLPVGIPIASFLAAFAFSGAGGNLNLAQSFYVKEKGYGMGKFSGRLTSILTGSKENIRLTGTRFPLTPENLKHFRVWWRLVNQEHALVFWAMGLTTILMLALLSYSTTHGVWGVSQGITFVILEGQKIGEQLIPFAGPVFLLFMGLFLFQTQLTVLDATSRIMSENLLLIKRGWQSKALPKIYYSFLWAQIVFGVVVFLTGAREPLFLITLSAVINAMAMFVHIGLTTWLNLTSLDKALRPSVQRVVAMALAFSFFGFLVLKLMFGL